MNDAQSPFVKFGAWYAKALELPGETPSAVILATVSQTGRPSTRVVLLKEWNPEGFVFYTNFGSRKAKELTSNPQASLLFYWEALGQQVRIEGLVERTSVETSREYFQSRPLESQWGAWASRQSRPLENRTLLEERFTYFRETFPDNIPLPDFWGGFRLVPDYFEFWQNGEFRLHHRKTYRKQGDRWETTLLYP